MNLYPAMTQCLWSEQSASTWRWLSSCSPPCRRKQSRSKGKHQRGGDWAFCKCGLSGAMLAFVTVPVILIWANIIPWTAMSACVPGLLVFNSLFGQWIARREKTLAKDVG